MIPEAARRVVRRLRVLPQFDPLLLLPPPARVRSGLPEVLPIGWFGHGNYGDELFLDVFSEHLGARVRLTPPLDGTAGGSSSGTSPRSAVDATDAVLIGGGDIVSPWSPRSGYWAREHLRRPVFVAGVGVPTWRPADPAAIARMRRFFGHSSLRYVHARDEESAAWIDRHLAPRVPVVIAPDLVCGLTLPQVNRPGDPPVLGIAVRRRASPDDLTHVRRLVRRGIELGYRIRRIVLATGATLADDLDVAEELDVPGTELVVSEDLAVLTRAIGECTVLATMKFHGLVVATMYGVPALALIRTDKNRNFLRRIDRPDLATGIDDPELADRLSRDVPPIDPAIPAVLRAESVAMLADLADRLAAV